MSLRPRVRVFQDYDEPTFPALVPDLETVIIGPAYHIVDLSTHSKSDLHAGSYGDSDAESGSSGVPEGLPSGSETAITISELPKNILGSLLDHDSVVVFFENIWAQVEDALGDDGVVVEDENELASSSVDFTAVGVQPGDRVVLNPETLTDWDDAPLVRKVKEVKDENTLVLNGNVVGTGSEQTSIRFRVERFIPSGQVSSDDISFDGNEVSISGGVEINDLTVNSAEAFITYRALRQNLDELTTLENSSVIEDKLGVIDERNPLAVGAFVAFQNTGTQIKVFGITKDDLNGASDRVTGYLEATDFLGNREDVYSLVPLTTDTSVLASLTAHAEHASHPDRSRFRIVLGSAELPEKKIVSSESIGDTLEDSEVNVLVHDGASFDASLEGKTITISGINTATDGEYVVEKVLSEKALYIPGLEDPGTADTYTEVDYTIGEDSETNVTVVLRGVFDKLNDNGAEFESDDVRVGDYVSIPSETTFEDGTDLYTVVEILSENRVRIDPTGTHGELPVNAAETEGVSTDYRIERVLSKGNQVEELEALAQSFSTSRLTLSWPGSVRLAGVQNNETGVASWQPGFYLACALGGQIAGLPPHQSLTGISIAGISELQYSSTYFTDSQLDQLMEAGWNVYTQATSHTPPESLRSLTTDVSMLETMELMVVKNYDYVSTFYRDLLRNFKKGYNVLPETLEYVRVAFVGGTETLKSRDMPKIGAPVLNAELVDVRIKDGAADTLEVLARVDIPRALNSLDLYLTI